MKLPEPTLLLAIFVLLALNLAGGVLIKFSPEYYGKYFALGVLVFLLAGIYLLRTVMWLFLGKRYQISFIYPFLSVNYVVSLFVGMAVFHEPFSFRRLLGALVILSGVALLSCSKHRDETRSSEVFE